MTRERTLDTVGLLARLALGGVLLAAGLLKIGDLTGSVQSVIAYELFPYEVSRFIGTVLPVLETALGVLLLLGLFTRVTALLGGLLMLVFIAGIVSAWTRGLSIDCGCFGDGGPVAPEDTRYLQEIVRDALLALAAAWLVVRPGSLVSLDGLILRKGSPA
jgi:uncharacterized membrane protein YphA (DoxX/SURF4 family)